MFCTKTCYISGACLEAIQNSIDEQDNIFNLSLDSTSVVRCSIHTCLLFAKKN